MTWSAPRTLARKVQNRLAALLLGRDRFDYWQRRGYHVLPVSFYSPVPDTRALPARVWPGADRLVAVDLAVDEQLERLAGFRARFAEEYGEFPVGPTPGESGFHLDNGTFGPGDAEILYCMVRDLQPGRIIEIGSGMSTLVIDRALAANREHGAPPCTYSVIDPFPSQAARSADAVTVLRAQPVQDVELAVFEELDAGDVLFIDSSHVVATGSDVVFEYLEVLPRLRPGVVVHAHDIFLPREYPRSWLVDHHLFWNEQYLLAAFLTLNPSFHVLWSGRYLHEHHWEALTAALPSMAALDPAGDRGPCSFWMTRDRG
jgi:predicted O-methyltransferase YrrM